MEVGTIISIAAVTISLITLILSRKDKAVKDVKENDNENANQNASQRLIEYQLKEIKDDNKEIKEDLKEIRRTLLTYKDTFRNMVDEKIAEHVRVYHAKES
ncbi:MAG: hypothetical protein J6S67_10845 [Methanobrevibacter sp.]|nr:hypothetical protein [Methanobrevibacter sp.]